MFDTTGRYELIRHKSHHTCLTPHRQHFHAIVMIKMDVEGSNDDFLMVMLDISQECLDISLMVVINQCNGASDLAIPFRPLVLH